MDLFIRNIPSETVENLEQIAVDDGISRNALIIKILRNYCICKDSFLSDSLPAIVRSLVKSELERLTCGAKSVENNVYLSSQKLMKTAEKLELLLVPELEKREKSELKNDEILKMLTFNDTDI